MTLSERDVRTALAELGRLRFEVTDVEEAMRDIVRVTHTVFQVDGAALLLTDEEQHLRVAAASDDRVGHLEELQLEHAEGPVLDAFHDRQVVQSEDLLQERRWPGFGPAAGRAGVRAVLASPVPFEQEPIGVVVIVSAACRPWTPAGELALVAFSDLAALLIATTLHAEQQSTLAVRLRAALDARQPITSAAAVLAEQEGVSLRAAEQRLRALARSSGRSLSEVAADLTADPGRVAPTA